MIIIVYGLGVVKNDSILGYPLQYINGLLQCSMYVYVELNICKSL